MRLVATALCLTLLSLPAIGAEADPDIVAKVTTAAAKGYGSPADAEVRNVRLSKAMNGTGYCGEISVEGADGTFTVFHVLLETPSGPVGVARLGLSQPGNRPAGGYRASAPPEFRLYRPRISSPHLGEMPQDRMPDIRPATSPNATYRRGSYRMATAPEASCSRSTSCKSMGFDRPVKNVGP